MTLSAGTKLGPYEIVGPVGAGGMGEVYRARDPQLKREVAIKVLPKSYAQDRETLSRFRQEAEVVAALNHPNVVSIYHVGQQDGAPYIVTELLQGGTLRDKIQSGLVSVRKAVNYALQIVHGLAAAHGKGIVHRDLKPENIFITVDGRLKILDFGLAKLTRPEADPDAETRSGEHDTRKGQVLGTVGYMAPEQVRGQATDARSDIFAFGAILYEMLSGKRAFEGATPADTQSAILKEEPSDFAALQVKVPPALDSVVRRCLEKAPEHRFQSALDLGFALEATIGLPEASPPAPSPAKRRLWWLAAAAVLLLATVVVTHFVASGSARLTDKDSIVIADFDNKTGDALFDDTLKQGLSIQLEQSPFLYLVSDRKVNETLKLMGRPAGDRLTPEVTHEVCQRTGSKAMVSGSIAELGSQYVIGLKATNCSTGDVLAEAQEQGAGKEAVLKALGRAAVSLRGKVGESLSSVEKYATPLEEATTPSLDALKAYSLGQKMRFAKGDLAALPFYKHSVELDPNFAMPYVALAISYMNLPEPGRAADNARKAYALRDRVSERERLYIEGIYYLATTGELDKAAQAYELLQRMYPRDPAPYSNLAYIYTLLGNFEKALDGEREALLLEPNNENNYSNLGALYVALNRLDEADAVYKRADERKLEGEGLLANRYQVAFLKGDAAQMKQLFLEAMGKPGLEDWFLAAQADTEAWYGKLNDARKLTRRAMDSAEHNDDRETAATYRAVAALLEVASGNGRQARADADAAIRLAASREVREVAAVALAMAGDTAPAAKLADELDNAFPLDTLIQRYWLPSIRAAIALNRKDPTEAIELLKVASAVELGGQTNLPSPVPAYLRGEAYLMLRDPNAAAEFQKFIDHRGLVGNFQWGALARLGLARAYALDAETDSAARDKARAAYKDFLDLWKGADTDVPIQKQAREEYAKLR